MKRQTFILKATKTFRYFLKLYIKNSEDKTDQRMITFTTEHKVSEKERAKNGRKINAEFSTSDENIIDALYRDTGYGKVFAHKDDPKGERKKVAFTVTPVDAEKIALSNLFKAAGLEFDPSKSVDVLNKEYSIYVSARAGVKIKESTSSEIPHKPVDIQQQLSNAVNAGRKAYYEKYGEPFPEFERKEEMYAFIDALSNPDFDAEAFLAEKQSGSADDNSDDTSGDSLPNDIEKLRDIYFNEFGANVANPKKNDAAWMKQKIEEKRAK